MGRKQPRWRSVPTEERPISQAPLACPSKTKQTTRITQPDAILFRLVAYADDSKNSVCCTHYLCKGLGLRTSKLSTHRDNPRCQNSPAEPPPISHRLSVAQRLLFFVCLTAVNKLCTNNLNKDRSEVGQPKNGVQSWHSSGRCPPESRTIRHHNKRRSHQEVCSFGSLTQDVTSPISHGLPELIPWLLLLSSLQGETTPRGRHARTKMSLQSMGGRSLAFLTRCQLRFCRHPVRAAMLMLVAVSLMCLYTFLFPVNPDGFVTHVRASGQNLSSTKPTDKLAKRFNPTAKEDKDKRSIILKTKGQNYFTGSKEEIDSTVTQGLDFSSKRKDNLRNTTLNKIRLRSVLLLLKGGRQTVAPLQSISSKPSGTFTAKLKSSSWKRITHTTSTTVRPPTDAELRVFRRRVNDSELQIFGKLLDAFSATLTQARIPFFLYGGTLIGSWRHHGPIPWDDDADVAIPFAKRRRVQELLATIGPDFMVRTRGNQTTKFYHHDSSKAGGQMWRWPFIDVCFYVENATHIWDPDKYFPEYHFPKEIVFPLTQRPYMGRMLPTPKDTKAFLTHTYTIDKCLVGHYSHRIENGRPDSDRGDPVDCRVLHSVYPFVHRVNVEGAGCNETLVDHGAVVSWYLAANVTCQE